MPSRVKISYPSESVLAALNSMPNFWFKRYVLVLPGWQNTASKDRSLSSMKSIVMALIM